MAEMFDKKEWKIKNREKINLQARKYTRNYRKRNANNPDFKDKERKRQKIWWQKRKKVKRFQLIELKKEGGGCCSVCGYKEEIRILHFHHLRDKQFEISRYTRSIEKIKEEVMKCILLCPNCHAILHLRERK